MKYFDPRSVFTVQKPLIKAKNVKQSTLAFTTYSDHTKEKVKTNTCIIFYDNQGRDTLTVSDGVVEKRTFYDSVIGMKIQLHYSKYFDYPFRDTTHEQEEHHDIQLDPQFCKSCAFYDRKGRLILYRKEPDTIKVKPTSPFTKIFGSLVFDSLQFTYNRRNQVIKEKYIIRRSQSVPDEFITARFKYNSKGLLTSLTFSLTDIRVSYIYR